MAGLEADWLTFADKGWEKDPDEAEKAVVRTAHAKDMNQIHCNVASVLVTLRTYKR